MNHQVIVTPMNGKPFLKAFLLNTLWVNVSGLPRYFLLIKPMLHDALPNDPKIAPVSLAILASWGLWTLVFMLVTTGFYWMYFDRNGTSTRSVIVSAIWVTLATIGLTWLGIVNMGLLPVVFLGAAMAWATIEQLVSAFIVSSTMKRELRGRGD